MGSRHSVAIAPRLTLFLWWRTGQGPQGAHLGGEDLRGRDRGFPPEGVLRLARKRRLLPRGCERLGGRFRDARSGRGTELSREPG